LPPAPPVQKPPAAPRQVEDGKDDLTPVQRFERAIRRRDAVAAKQPEGGGKNDPGR
jgi:hypothetical protein